MAELPAPIKNFLGGIDKLYDHIGVFKQFEGQTGLPKLYAVVAGIVVYLFITFTNVGGIGELLSNIAGFCVPVYYSLVALETTTTKDDTQLLTYWVVFGFLNMVEFWSKAILYWIPFYWLFKTIGLVYLAVPSTGAAQQVYTHLIKPIAQAHVMPHYKAQTLSKTVEDFAEGALSALE